MKNGVTLLTARGWMDGQVIEARAALAAPLQGIWHWCLTGVGDHQTLAYGKFQGNPRQMANELLNIVEGANDDVDSGGATQGAGREAGEGDT